MDAEEYSLEVRRRVAIEAAKSSFDEGVKTLEVYTGAHVPQRQFEELVIRAAQDFEAFTPSARQALAPDPHLGSGAPPGSPAVGIGEEPEDNGLSSFNDKCVFEQVRSFGHSVSSTFLRFLLTAARPRPSAALFQLRSELQPVQCVVPHAFEHLAERAKRFFPGAVEAVLAIPAHIEQTRFGERAEVQRDRAEGDVRHRAVNVPGVTLLVPHQP
jgi:hypothetical protein